VVVIAVGVATWREQKEKRFAEANVREKEGDLFCKEEELGVLSSTCKVCGTNECMPRVSFLNKKKKQKINFNTPLRWVDKRTKSETFVEFRDEKRTF
jgi:hypothetical protein